MNAFGDFFDQLNILIALVQFSFRVVKSLISEALEEKFSSIVKLFNLQNSDKTNEDLKLLLKPFLKNNYKDIFNDKSLSSKFMEQFRQIIKQESYFNENEIENIGDVLEVNKEDVMEYFNYVKVLCLYMQINEPQITLNEITLPAKSSLKEEIGLVKFVPDQYSIIDGFEKDGSPCAVVLNQP